MAADTSGVEAPCKFQCAACDWRGNEPIDGGDHLRYPACPECLGDVIEAGGAGVTPCGEPSREQRLERALSDMEARKDGAYEERNKVVAALAKVFPSGIARTAIEGWSEDWHGCVYIDLPTGQVSWHFHDSQAHLFAGLPPYTKPWDGHDTDEKYRRVAALGVQPSDGGQKE